MSIEAIAGLASAAGGGGLAAPQVTNLGPTTQVSPGAEGRFGAALDRANGVGGNAAADRVGMPEPMQGMFRALDSINSQAGSVSDYARSAEASGGQLTPGEIVQLTMKCQEFMFQCQLTSNIANRSSDGVQQLFKQQG